MILSQPLEYPVRERPAADEVFARERDLPPPQRKCEHD
jgi:hypothetical protein